MIIQWKECGLRFDPENAAEHEFLDGLQDLFRTIRMEMKHNPLPPERKRLLLSRFAERLDFNVAENDNIDNTRAD